MPGVSDTDGYNDNDYDDDVQWLWWWRLLDGVLMTTKMMEMTILGLWGGSLENWQDSSDVDADLAPTNNSRTTIVIS